MNDVKKNKERKLAREREDHQEYINEVAQHAVDDDEMRAAVIRSFASSDKAMSNLAKSDEAMSNLAKCDGAVMKLVIMRVTKSDEVLAKLAQSDEVMMKLLGPEMFQTWKAHRSKPAE